MYCIDETNLNKVILKINFLMSRSLRCHNQYTWNYNCTSKGKWGHRITNLYLRVWLPPFHICSSYWNLHTESSLLAVEKHYIFCFSLRDRVSKGRRHIRSLGRWLCQWRKFSGVERARLPKLHRNVEVLRQEQT